MAIDTERISGYADALDAVEQEIRRVLLNPASAETTPGLEVALATIQDVRSSVNEYHYYLCDLRDRVAESEWDDGLGPETECVPCMAETAPHTCLGC